MSGEPGLHPGLEVVTDDGEAIGHVKELLDNGYFRVDCPRAQDYYIPGDAIAEIGKEHLRLRVTKAQAAYLGWEVKPLQ